jgi:anti-sigma regulatory factor (Ser/Thr protein kinase)
VVGRSLCNGSRAVRDPARGDRGVRQRGRAPEEPTAHLVEIKGTVTNHAVAIFIRDYGRWQDESSAREEGGLGLAIMDELMDSVVVEPFEDGTTVTMHRRLAMR